MTNSTFEIFYLNSKRLMSDMILTDCKVDGKEYSGYKRNCV